MASIYRSFVLIGSLGVGLFVICEPARAAQGFHAQLEGAKTATINQPGYFFCQQSVNLTPDVRVIADYFGMRDAGITFVVPINFKPGNYPLTEVSPADAGQKLDVRVDASDGKRSNSYRLKTTGSLTLTSIPGGYKADIPLPAVGRFDFETQNEKGDKVHAKGTFDFDPASKSEMLCSRK